jgi:hypothetical protein
VPKKLGILLISAIFHSLVFISIVFGADTTPPSVTLNTPAGTNGWQTSNSFQISWSGTDSESTIKAVDVYRQDGSGPLNKLGTSSSGVGTSSVSGSLQDTVSGSNTYHYQVQVTDNANNVGVADGYVRVDLINPNLSLTSPPNNFVTSDSSIELRGNASDFESGISRIQIFKNGSVVTNIDYSGPAYPQTPSWSSTITGLNSGNNSLGAQASDASGRVSNAQSVVVDYEPPRFTTAGVQPAIIRNLGDVINASYKINIDGRVRISIVDATGKEYGVIQDGPQAWRSKDMDYSTGFYGAVFTNNQWSLLENGYYFIKAKIQNVNGNDYSNPESQFTSQQLDLNQIARTAITARVYTPSNPANMKILVPTVSLGFLTQIPSLGSVTIPAGPTGNYMLPTTGSYQVHVEKSGYPATDFSGFNPSSAMDSDNDGIREFVVEGFKPYIPGEAGYLESVDSDGDGISDGWEYKYWRQWQGWIPAYGCDLSQSDGQYDADGDGLTNLEEYQLQRYFPDLDLHTKDLLVQLDWVRSSSRNYAPNELAKQTCSQIFQATGVRVHWSPQGHEIPMSDSITNAPSVSLAQLEAVLNQNQRSYGYSNSDGDTDIVHAVFAPGWTVIEGLTQTETTSTGGLYLQSPPGIFVFDLHTRNLVAGRVEDSTDSPLLNQYEGNILTHELGHVLGLPDRGN